jgi:hypothetical protein
VELLAHRAQLRGVQQVLGRESPDGLGDGQDPVAHEGRLVGAQKVLGALADVRDEELDALAGLAESRRRTDVARRGRGRGVRQDDLRQAVGKGVADVRVDVGAPDEADHREQGPHIHADGLGLDLLSRADVELAGEGRVRVVQVVGHAGGVPFQAQGEEVLAAAEHVGTHEPPEVGCKALREVHQGQPVR